MGRRRRGLIEPLLIVDQADQRAFPGHPGQQAQHGQPHEEPVRRRPWSQAERGPQRVPLRHRQPPGAIQHRRAQLMQPRKCEFHLRLHAGRVRDPAPRTRRPPGQVVQQHGLAHTRLAAHHQDPALAGPDRAHQPVQRIAFVDPVRQPGRAAPPLGLCGHALRRVRVAWLGMNAHTARALYGYQEFHFAGPYGDNGWLEEYTAGLRGEPIGPDQDRNGRCRDPATCGDGLT